MLLMVAMPVMAQSTTPTPTATPKAHRPERTVNVSCIQDAVKKRDNAIISALDVFASSAKIALTTRRDALVVAWAITDRNQRRTALRSAWNAFRDAARQTRQVFQQSKKSAWSTFNKDRHTCNTQGEGEDNGGGGFDSSL